MLGVLVFPYEHAVARIQRLAQQDAQILPGLPGEVLVVV